MQFNKREIKIGIVDDHPLFSKGLAFAIGEEGKEREAGYNVLFTACNGNEMIQWIDQCGAPDIIILDIEMPGMDGFESLDWLRLNKPEIKVIMYAMHKEEALVIRAFKNGACAWFTKGTDLSKILNAIDAASADNFYKQKIDLG